MGNKIEAIADNSLSLEILRIDLSKLIAENKGLVAMTIT